MNKRLMATAVLAGAIVLAGATSASAEDYTGAVSATSAGPGATIIYTATAAETELGGVVAGSASLDGAKAEEEATLTSVKTASISSKADGSISIAVKLPTTAPAGSVYTLDVSVGTFQDTATITLAAAPSDVLPDTGSTLPSTGVDATPYIWFGGGLLLLGAGIISVLAFVRRSRNA